jgi:hypothetical protein
MSADSADSQDISGVQPGGDPKTPATFTALTDQPGAAVAIVPEP